MPTYDYRCTEGHTFEVFQSITDDALTKCEVCGKPVQRVLHAPAVHFKGSGFYTTDYARKGSKQAASDSSGKESSKNGDSSSSDSKSDSKPKPEKSSSSSD
jgi:putative FmdB family regulatory protein